MLNKFNIDRAYKGRVLKLRAVYNEATDDWNIVLFEGKKILDTRVSTDVYLEARDMFELALDNPPKDPEDDYENRVAFNSNR
jgi:hypothetical protein